MATQDDNGISFSIKKEDNRQQIRLLELPPELLSLLTSNEPPVLKFKSKAGESGNELNNNAVLCTPTSTYNIRQVNHSNSQYITRPAPSSGQDLSNPAIEAFASSGFVLEVAPDKPTSAVPYLKATVPLGIPSVTGRANESRISKQEHFDNVPLDDEACERAWLEVGCSEVDGVACRSDYHQQLAAWEYMLSTLVAEGIDPLAPLTPYSLRLLSQGLVDVETSSHTLDAMIAATTENDALHHDKCLRCVGVRLLSQMGRAPLADFMQQWKDLLPEKWRDDVTTELINGHYNLRNSDKEIVYQYDASKDIPSGTTAPPEPKSTATTKRKWHEKFRPSKKTV